MKRVFVGVRSKIILCIYGTKSKHSLANLMVGEDR
jgi:hypothetical protein